MKKIFDNLKKKSDDLLKKADEFTNKVFSENEKVGEVEDADVGEQNQEQQEPVVDFQTTDHSAVVQNGKIFYIPQSFDFEVFSQELSAYLAGLGQEVLTFRTEPLFHVLQYRQGGGIKGSLGLNAAYQLYIKLEDDRLNYVFHQSQWQSELKPPLERRMDLSSMLSSSKESEILDFMIQHLEKSFGIQAKQFSKSRYCPKNQPFEAFWLAKTLNTTDMVLAWLEAEQVKCLVGGTAPPEGLHWRYMLSIEAEWLVGFGENDAVEKIDKLDDRLMLVKKEIGRSPVKVGQAQWLSTRSNGDLYLQLQSASNLEGLQRVRESARLNWVENPTDTASNQFAYSLLQWLSEKDQHPFDELSLLFAQLAEGNRDTAISKNISDQGLLEAIRKILALPNSDEEFMKWADLWKLSHVDKMALMGLLLEAELTNMELHRLLPFHRKIRTEFQKKSSDKINLVLLEKKFCQHLIACDMKEEAIEILEKQIKNLPDETLSELLPDKKVSPFSMANGQFLKVGILELLLEAKGKENEPSVVRQLAQIQPLHVMRLQDLLPITSSSLHERAQEIIETLTVNTSPYNKEYEFPSVAPITDEAIASQLKHPATREHALFGTLQSWLAEVDNPDQSAVKAFSEKVEGSKHDDIQKIVLLIEQFFSMGKIEAYITRGEKEKGIFAYEGEPDFITIGVAHLEETDWKMGIAEMAFALASETAHLKLKHKRIGLAEIWRGTKDKGMAIVDTILAFIPFGGTLGKSLSVMFKVKAVSRLLEKTAGIKDLASQGTGLVESMMDAIGVIQNTGKTNENSREDELLATSRVMQLTAERAGLLFAGKFAPAVKAVVLNSPSGSENWKTAQQFGLVKLLEQQNELGEYLHLDLAIRLKALASFYLSDEYLNLRDSFFTKAAEKSE